MEQLNVKQIVLEMSLVGTVLEEVLQLLQIVSLNAETESEQVQRFVMTVLRLKTIRNVNTIALAQS